MAATDTKYRLNNYILAGPLTPLGNNVLVKPSKLQEKTRGGLFVQNAACEASQNGLVVAAGPGRTHPGSGELHTCPVEVGDLVLLNDFTGEKVEYQGESHTFVNADTLLGVFEGRVKTEDAFRPLRGRLLVSKDEMESCTSSGIAIAGQKNDDSNTGQVVAAGAGPGPLAADSAALATVNAGQYVMYDRYAAVDASIGDKKYVVVSEQDCIATWFGG